jgi:hypothetical protein
MFMSRANYILKLLRGTSLPAVTLVMDVMHEIYCGKFQSMMRLHCHLLDFVLRCLSTTLRQWQFG